MQEHLPEIDPAGLVGERAVADDQAAVGQAVGHAHDSFAGDCVDPEADIGPAGGLADALRQVRPVEDHGVGAQVLQLLNDLLAPHEIDRAIAPLGRQDDQIPPDVGIGRILQHPFALLQVHEVGQQGPGRCAVDVGEHELFRVAGRGAPHAQAVPVDPHVLGERAAAQWKKHAVADLVARIRAGFHDAAHALEARRDGQGTAKRVDSLDQLDVGDVHGAGFQPGDDFARSRSAEFNLLQPHHVGRFAVFVEPKPACPHRCGICPAVPRSGRIRAPALRTAVR